MKKKIELMNYNSLLFFMLRGCFIGICVNNLFATSKGDSWLSIIIAILVGFLPLLLLFYIMDKYPDKNIFEILKDNFGIIGEIINYLLLGFTFILCAFVFWNMINFLSSQLLYRTPNMAIGIVFLFAITSLLNKGLNVISKVSLILFYFVIIFYAVSFLGLIIQIKPALLTPLFKGNVTSLGLGSIHYLAFNILPIMLLLIIPKNKINENEHLKKTMTITYFATSVMLFMVIFIILTTYGVRLARLLQYPEYHLLKRLSILGFIERTENIFSFQWMFDSFIFITFCLHVISEKISYKGNLKNVVLSVALLLFTVYVFQSSTSTHNLILKVLPYFSYIFLLGMPLLIFIKKKIT